MSILDWFVVAGFICLIAELIIGVDTGFDLVLIGCSFIAGYVVAKLIPVGEDSKLYLALATTGVVTFAYVFFARSMIRHRLATHVIPSNVDKCIGALGVVKTKADGSGIGQVLIEGEIWRAKIPGTLEIGEEVRVQSVSGVTLTVVKSN